MGIPEINSNQNQDSSLDSFDLDKVINVLKGSIPWILLILLLTNSLAYIYNRYTQPVYESESILKLDIKSEAGLLGLQNTFGQDANNISGEIELLRSRLFFKKVVKAVNQSVSYYHPGRSNIVDERYGNSPFVVSYRIKNNALYDKKINLNFIDDHSFELSYNLYGINYKQTHKFGLAIEADDFNFLIEKTDFFEESKNVSDYYFIIHSEKALIDYFEKNIKVEPVNIAAKTIKISLTHTNKNKVKDLVTAIDTLYLNYTKEAKNRAVEQKLAFLEGQFDKNTKQLEAYEDYFENFIIENRTTSLSGDISRSISLLNALDSQRLNLKSRIASVDLINKQMKTIGILPLSPFDINKLPEFLQTAIENYNALLIEKELKLASYNENTFVIQQIVLKLAVAKKNATEQVLTFKKILLEELDLSESRRKSLESTFLGLPSMGTEYNKKKRFYALHEKSYLSIFQSKIELEILMAGTVTDFVILSPASVPVSPIHPQKGIIIGIGLAVGLILSFLFIALKYLLHNKISSHGELQRLIKSPILGLVPYYTKEKLALTKMVIDGNPKSAISEALRSIRTNIEFMLPDFRKKVISVTSTVGGEGKTFIAVNLGAILAYSKLKVVVVDLDMRKAKIHLAFNQEKGTNGVSTILIDKSTIEESINKTDVNNLDFISAGPMPPNPSELIISKNFPTFIESLKKKYDVIIFDTPPVGLVTDGILVMRHSNLPIYVVRADYSKKDYVKSINSLATNEKFNNLSVILNSVKSNRNQGYGYGYGYGDGYYDDEDEASKSIWSKFFKKKS